MLNPGKWINGRTSIDPLSGKIMENPTFWLNKQSSLVFFAIHLSVSINLFIQALEGRKVPKIQKLVTHHLSWLRSCELYLSTCLFLVIFPYFSFIQNSNPCPKPLQHLLRRTALPVQVPAPQSALAPGGIGHPLHLGPWQWLLSNIHGTHPGCVWNSGI